MGAFVCRICRSVTSQKRTYCPACGKGNALAYNADASEVVVKKKPVFKDLRTSVSRFGGFSMLGAHHLGFDDPLSKREREELAASGGLPFDDLDDFEDEPKKRAPKEKIQSLGAVSTPNYTRISTGFENLDKVLGDNGSPSAGAPLGACILLSGQAGVGKSTLLTQVLCHVSGKKFAPKTTIYASAEEQPEQFRLRCERIGLWEKLQDRISKKLLVQSGDVLETLLERIEEHKPQVVVMDSVSTYRSEEIEGAVGEKKQCKYIGKVMTEHAHKHGYVLFMIAHQNKDGTTAGPQFVQHQVDIVIEAELFQTLSDGSKVVKFNIPRKNRFGKTGEGISAVFVMSEKTGVLVPQDEDEDVSFVVTRKTKLEGD